MDDASITELFRKRDERALAELKKEIRQTMLLYRREYPFLPRGHRGVREFRLLRAVEQDTAR